MSVFFLIKAQNAPHIDSVGNSKLTVVVKEAKQPKLDSLWQYSLVDDPKFLSSSYNDSAWPKASTLLSEQEIKRIGFRCFVIFRMHLKLDSSSSPKAIYFRQTGASEVYINGVLQESFGVVSCDPDKEVRVSEPYRVIFMPRQYTNEYLIAVRYSNTQWDKSYNSAGVKQGGFKMGVNDAKEAYKEILAELSDKAQLGMAMFVFFATVGALHLLLFVFYTVRRSNLYLALFCLVISFYFLFYYLVNNEMSNVDAVDYMMFAAYLSTPLFFISLQSVIYSFFYERFPKLFYWSLVFSLIILVSYFFHLFIGILVSLFFVIYTVVEMIRVLIIAIIKKKKGSILITLGFGFFLLFFVGLILTVFFTGNVNLSGDTVPEEILAWLFALGIASMPISMSIFLAWDFAGTNKILSRKLIEVEELSVRTIEQEKERQKILAEQNEVLEVQVEERTREINEQKKVIEEKNKDITDSINYAQRIQHSILPTAQEIKGIFNNSFVLFKPRDIVSGDFYQFKKNGELRYAVLADCTGHGVPGALMSMIGSNLLKQIILERGTKEPHKILSELHREVRSTLRQTEGIQSHDGMDASIVLQDGKKLFIASANRPVYIVKNGELTELKPDKRSIGGSSVGDDVTFHLNELEIEAGMMIYLFSDGYADQFGGEKGKKFKVKNLSDLLVSISEKPLEIQKEILDTTFNNWKKHLEQVDDVSLIGLRF